MSATISYITAPDQSQEPVFTEIDGPRAFREHQKPEERDSVLAIVQLWNCEKFLCMEWKDGQHAFVTGGIERETGETIEETLMREVREESGYWHILFRRTLKGQVHDKFFHPDKQVNRFAHFTIAYCMVTDEHAVGEISKAELDVHVPRWILRRDVEGYLNVDSHKYVWNRFLSKKP